MTQPDSFETWRKGFGPIVHSDETIERVRALAATTGVGAETLYRILIAADRLAGAAMWTVVHMSYAERVALSGAPLPAAAARTGVVEGKRVSVRVDLGGRRTHQ